MYAIRGDHAFDGSGFLPGGATVLIDGSRIVGVESAAYDVPADCPVTDHGDATVLPGLVDSHVHLVADGSMAALDKVSGYSSEELDAVVTGALRRSLAAGVTTVRDLGDRDFNVVARRDAQRASDDGLPWIVAAGPPITTVGGHCCYLGGEVAGPGGIEAALRQRVERRVDVVKVMASGGVNTAESDMFAAQFRLDELRLLVDGAHAAGLPVAAHAHAAAAMDQLVTLDVQTIEHASYLTRNDVVLPGLLGLLSSRATDEQLAALATSGAAVCPTAGGLTSGQRLPPPVQQLFDDHGVAPEEFVRTRVTLVTRMAEAGVRFVGGMDAGIAPPKDHGLNAASVIDLASSTGTLASLVASTSTGAEVCGLSSSKGRLALGYDADVLVVGGDLSHDLERLRDVRQVVLRGTIASF